MLRRIRKKSYDLAGKIVRNFTPELKQDRRSLLYLLEKKSVEEAVDYVFNNMRNAQAFHSRYELYDFVSSWNGRQGWFSN